MTKDIGRVAEATGLSQVEPQEGLAPTGFDPSRYRDRIAREAALLAYPGSEQSILSGKADDWIAVRSARRAVDAILAEIFGYGDDDPSTIASNLTPAMRQALLSRRAGNIAPGNGGVSYALTNRGLARYVPTRAANKNRFALTDLGIAVRAVLRFSDSDGSPKGGDACGSVHDSAGPKDIAPKVPS